MKFNKQILDEMKRCYCASHIKFDGVEHIFLASEDPNIACNMYSGENFEIKENVWSEPGGCMSIVPIPGKEKEFLCVQEFYLKVTPSLAKLVWAKYGENGWEFKDLVSLPYVHRFGILNKNGVNYLLAATVATSKKEKNDWSVPGRVYAAVLPDSPEEGIELEVLVEGLYRNHGFWQTKENGEDVGYFGSDQGIVKVSAPEKLGGQFKVELVMEGKIGEIATIDIDGDGEDEIMTIEEFHGNTIQIYKKIDGKYEKVWKYDNEIDFAHSLVGDTLAGKNAFICGVRRMDCELFVVTYENGEYKVEVVDKGVGPANLCIVHEENRDIIVGANHTAAQAAIYYVSED